VNLALLTLLHGRDVARRLFPDAELCGRIVAALDCASVPHKRRSLFNVIDTATFWKADLIFRKARPFSRGEMSRRVAIEVLGVPAFVASAEDTVLTKLEWAKMGESERQLRDVRGIIDVKAESLDRSYIEQWLDDLGVRELWDRVRDG
jgi:hypothetical protein